MTGHWSLPGGTWGPIRRLARFVDSPTMTADEGALTERECWELLAMASVGRLALSVRALPVILPVQYYLSDHRLAVCLVRRVRLHLASAKVGGAAACPVDFDDLGRVAGGHRPRRTLARDRVGLGR